MNRLNRHYPVDECTYTNTDHGCTETHTCKYTYPVRNTVGLVGKGLRNLGLPSPTGYVISNNHTIDRYRRTRIKAISSLLPLKTVYWRSLEAGPCENKPSETPKSSTEQPRHPCYSLETTAHAKTSVNGSCPAQISARGCQISVHLLFRNRNFYKYVCLKSTSKWYFKFCSRSSFGFQLGFCSAFFLKTQCFEATSHWISPDFKSGSSHIFQVNVTGEKKKIYDGERTWKSPVLWERE